MNINCLVQKSCSVFSRGDHATDGNYIIKKKKWTNSRLTLHFIKADAEYVQNLLESIGTCDGQIDENLMDVFTGLSGSGPAYVIIEKKNKQN